jgi:tetratricopeptide (TPR) repeat protein
MENKFNFKIATFISLGLMLVIMLFTSKDFGISGDEMTQNTYGELVYKYYATFGKDKSCLEPFGRVDNAFYYGGFYDLLCVTVNKILHTDTFNTRHFINALFGFFIIVFAARLARFMKDWRAAFIVVWLLFLSPRFLGESMNNPKDIPFALGMLMGVYYILRFLKSFPKPGWKDIVGLTLSIGLAISTRVGGILLLPYLFVAVALYYFFEWRKQYSITSKEIKGLVVRCIAICVVGYFLGLVFWPYGLEAPLSNPFKALGELSQLSVNIGMLFDDKKMVSSQVPWYYIPKWIFISTPIIILAGIVASPWLLTLKEYKFAVLGFVFFAAIFPVAYVIYKKNPLYDGWRHLLFVYPPLIVLCGLTFTALIERAKSKVVRYGVVAALCIGLALPAKWCIANHPNEIVYFNEFTGGVSGAYGYYETDYYMNSLKQAAFKLAKMKGLFDTKDTVVIASNAIEPVIEYFKTINPKIVCVYVRYYQRYEKKWDYALLYTRFLDKELLQNGYFPPANTIAVIKADKAPLCAIVERDPEFLAYKANEFLKAKNFDSASVYFDKHLKKEPNDESSYYNYAVTLASLGKIPEAINAINTKLKYTPRDLQSYDLLIRIYDAIKDTRHKQEVLSRAQEIQQEDQGE